jgi:hypothetical protein
MAKTTSRVNAAGNYTKPAMRKALSPAEKAATNRAKAAGNAKGQQFVAQPKAIAKKTARHR